MEVLILGGTGEARDLAALLHADGVAVTTSLAGRTAPERPPPGALRTGGFGGALGLQQHLQDTRPDALIDATHPFAARMGANAVTAAAGTRTPLLRLERPGWSEQPGDRWLRATSLAEAAALAPAHGSRVLLTLGSHGVEAFAQEPTAWYLVRAIKAPQRLPPRHALLLDRGPFTPETERALLARHAIDLVVSRDAGGPQTAAKLVAARELQLPVLLVDRPPRPPGPAQADTPAAARQWVLGAR